MIPNRIGLWAKLWCIFLIITDVGGRATPALVVLSTAGKQAIQASKQHSSMASALASALASFEDWLRPESYKCHKPLLPKLLTVFYCSTREP